MEVVVVEDEGQDGAAQEREEKQLEESLGAGEVEGVEEVVEAQEDAVGSVERGEGEAGGGEQGVDGEKEPVAADVAVDVVRDGELAGVDAEKGQGKGEGFGVDGGEEAGGTGEDEQDTGLQSEVVRAMEFEYVLFEGLQGQEVEEDDGEVVEGELQEEGG